ncbi:TniB family NTP-binding protein [Streptomyces sp. NPDC057429]|uniref:TniB family NTP-binding protein n=1 Tax=Streptomyces sp. NPDC057429 TaxID=3346130 RepID=UPI0036C11000
MFVRTQHGWITVPWVHLPLVTAPFADFTWSHARRLAAQAGLDDTNEAVIARVLDELLTRAEQGPDKRTNRVVGRTRAAAVVPASTAEPESETDTAAAEAQPPRVGDVLRRLRRPRRSRKVAMSKPVPSPRPSTGTPEELPPDSPLTTKEGWRHFVGHDPVPPRLLPAAERAALSGRERMREDDRRREYHADLPLVNTPTIRKVIATARLLVQLNRNQVSARRGVILSGASGTGKTTALTQLGRAHELAIRKRYPRDGNRLPVLYATVPPAATPKMLAMEFARFFGLTFPTRANVTDVVDAVCGTAAHVHVDLVLVDELHNLNLGTRSGAEASDS